MEGMTITEHTIYNPSVWHHQVLAAYPRWCRYIGDTARVQPKSMPYPVKVQAEAGRISWSPGRACCTPTVLHLSAGRVCCTCHCTPLECTQTLAHATGVLAECAVLLLCTTKVCAESSAVCWSAGRACYTSIIHRWSPARGWHASVEAHQRAGSAHHVLPDAALL